MVRSLTQGQVVATVRFNPGSLAPSPCFPCSGDLCWALAYLSSIYQQEAPEAGL